jgi:hypothetical protein
MQSRSERLNEMQNLLSLRKQIEAKFKQEKTHQKGWTRCNRDQKVKWKMKFDFMAETVAKAFVTWGVAIWGVIVVNLQRLNHRPVWDSGGASVYLSFDWEALGSAMSLDREDCVPFPFVQP